MKQSIKDILNGALRFDIAQSLTDDQKAQARANIGAGTSNLTLAGNGSATTAAKSDHTHNYAGSSSAGGAATSANKVNAALTFNNSGNGAASSTTFDGSTAKIISYNTIGAAASSHNHDDRYYTETEINTKLSGKSDTSHNHDDKYLGKTAKAADSDKLDGKDSTYYLDYKNLSNTPSNATTSIPGLMSSEDKEHLDTLAALLENKDSTIDTITEVLKAFENAPEGTNIANALAGKVDKVDGKGLSTNDFTTAEKEKLAGIAPGANAYVLPEAGNSLGGVKSGGDVTITDGVISVNDDSHNHIISNIDGLQSTLDSYSNKITALEGKPGLDKIGTVTSINANGTSFNPDATGKIDLGNIGGGSGPLQFSDTVVMTEAEFSEAYLAGTLQDNKLYLIEGETGTVNFVSTADHIVYSNTNSGLTATNLQNAVDEMCQRLLTTEQLNKLVALLNKITIANDSVTFNTIVKAITFDVQ